MKLVKLILVFTLIFSVVIFISSCKKDEAPTEPENSNVVAIGKLTTNPAEFFVNTSTKTFVKLFVPAGMQLADSAVKLVKLDDNNKQVGNELGFLYDNGKLANGDEIIKDNVYTGIIYFYETVAGKIKLGAVAKVKQNNANVDGRSESATMDVFTPLTTKEYSDVVKTQSDASTQLNTYLAGNVNNLSNAMTQLATWLGARTEVQTATLNSSNGIEITYKNGLTGGIIVSVQGNSGGVQRGGYIPEADGRKSKSTIPLSKQTKGEVFHSGSSNRIYKTSGDPDPTIIGNRNVLIYAPYEAAFAPWNEGANARTILNNSGFEFQIDYYTNQAATVSVLNNLTDYGYVILATHGSGGKFLLTGEVIDTTQQVWRDSYKGMLKSGKLAVFNNVTISSVGAVTTTANVYGVSNKFISSLSGTFPNSVILNNSCESTKTALLSTAFTGKGAKTYYGYSKVVNSGFCVKNSDTLTKRLAKDLKTTADAFMAGSDPTAPNAVFQMVGANDVHYPDDLINGDFEYGKIQGWTKTGDGRVISQLGSQTPTGGSYMGIISTGLGYTTATGKIYQTFTVRNTQSQLVVRWNFLSEEFLEYINSQFQDYFTITVKDVKTGVSTTLLSRTIDGIASQFGATKTSAGNLIKVSPGIVFDVGDVYMTGWQSSTFDLSAFKNKRITLSIAAGDVGDSIYDTAILLDDIVVK